MDTQHTLKEGGRSVSSGRGRQALRRGLVVVEIALAVALLTAAGLLLKSFGRLLEVSPGFDPANTLTFNLALPEVQYPKEEQQAAFFARALERLKAVPGVRAAGASRIRQRCRGLAVG